MNSGEDPTWPRVKLGDYVDLITGFPFKSYQYCSNQDSIRLLRGDNVAQGFLRWDNAKLWPLSQLDGFDKFWLSHDDVILAMDRPWIEAGLKYAWITEKDLPCLLVQRVARLKGKNGLLTKFLRYIIADQSFTDYIKPIVTGVAVPHISGKQIQDYQFRLPPLPTQRKIAAILSAYDDLIENNTRRIKILEDMAQALYREWFVHFRFPGHEKVRMVDSPLGRIPVGWQIERLGNITDINAASLKNGNSPEEIHYVDISSVSTGQIDKIEHIPLSEAPSRARRVVKHGDVIWSTVRPNRKSYSLIINPPPDLIVSTGFAVISSRYVPCTYIYQALITDDFVSYLTNHATGAAYPAVNAHDFEDAVILLPHKDLMDLFHLITKDFMALKRDLVEKNANLRFARDLLLPNLINGRIIVNEIFLSEEKN